LAYAIIKRGAKGDGFFAVPCEGSSLFISPSQLVLYHLSENQELNEQAFLSLKEKLLTQRCKVKALDALARREHSKKELELKLRLKEYPQLIIEEVLDELEESKLLSDERYALSFIRSRQRRNPEGRMMLQRRLQQKGVERNLATEVIDHYFNEEEHLLEDLRSATEKAQRKKQLNDQELSAYLYQKGFLLSEIRLFLEEEKE